MTIRTISNLPSVSDISSECLFAVAEAVQRPDGSTGYISKKTSFGDIRDKVIEKQESILSDTYGLSRDWKVSDIRAGLSSVYEGDMNPTGDWHFENPPGCGKDDRLATESYVEDTIAADNSIYIGPNASVYPQGDMRIVGGGHESDDITVSKRGYMTVYGWLADTGKVSPANAWVALDGYINNRWEHLQVQSWCIGERHQQLQYVGFNMPVAKGLKIRIVTGFDVNGQNSGMQNINRSLTTESPNCFKCKVIA